MLVSFLVLIVLLEGSISSNTFCTIKELVSLNKIRYSKGLNATYNLVLFYGSNKPFFILRIAASYN